MISLSPVTIGTADLDPPNQVAADAEVKLSCPMPDRDQSTKSESSAAIEAVAGNSSPGEQLALSLKMSRQRRGLSSAQDISVWAQWRIWWAPFTAELFLFIAAMLLTIYLHQVIWSEGARFPTMAYLGLGIGYLLLISHNRLNELYLPRPVVFFGLGSLVLSSLVIMGIFITDAWLIGGQSRALYVLLAVVPMMAFLGRCVVLFMDARSTPPISALAMVANVKRNKFRDFRRKLRFWMS